MTHFHEKTSTMYFYGAQLICTYSRVASELFAHHCEHFSRPQRSHCLDLYRNNRITTRRAQNAARLNSARFGGRRPALRDAAHPVWQTSHRNDYTTFAIRVTWDVYVASLCNKLCAISQSLVKKQANRFRFNFSLTGWVISTWNSSIRQCWEMSRYFLV